MNTATHPPLLGRHDLPISGPRHDTRLFAFFLNKLGPMDGAALARRVWTNFLAETRVMLYARARDTLLDYCKQRTAVTSDGPTPRSRLHLALCGLPMDTRILLELRYVDQLSTAELALLYRTQRDDIRARLRDARRALEERLAIVEHKSPALP